MTCSTMNSSNSKFSSPGDSLRQTTAINYICPPTSEELKQKIYSVIRNIQLDSKNVLFQFWGAQKAGNISQKAGNTFVLTITDQPFGLSGNNKELQLYHDASLEHKLYVNRGKKVAFGLSGHAFLTCTPVQTQNLHSYPEDERPPSNDDAIFSRIWGSFAVPVIVDDQCVGVLECVMDTPKDSYDSDIAKVYRVLKMELPIQNASLQTPIKKEEPKKINKMIRRSKSFNHSKYYRLVPHFGLTRDNAAAKLGLTKSTFKNVCKRVRIYEWPWIPSTNPKTRINLSAASKTSSSQIPVALENKLEYSDDSSFYMDTDTFELACEQTTNARAPIPETQIDQIASSKTSPSQIPADALEDINIDDWLNDMVTDTDELSCEQTTNARTSVPETQIDQIAASGTRSSQISVGIQEDNGFSDNCFSDLYMDKSAFELQCEQTINDRLTAPETQINQANAIEARSFEFPNTTNLYDHWDMNNILEGLCEQTTNTRASVSQAQINQNAPVTWNIEFEHPGSWFHATMPEYDEMNYQGWYGPIQSKLRVT